MSIIEQARKIAREQARQSALHFAAQNTANAKRSSDPSLEQMRDYKTPQIAAGIGTCVAAAPIKAVVRPEFVDLQPVDQITLADCAPATTCGAPVPQTGAPVNVSRVEYQRLKPEDQARIRAQCLAYDGARDRIKNHGTTLATAFYAELDLQSSIVRRSGNLAMDGKKRIISKSAAKKRGYRKMNDAGVASFKGLPTRVESMPNGTFIMVQDKVPNDPIQGYTIVRKLKSNELKLIELLQGK
jgi:hypothetical protein